MANTDGLKRAAAAAAVELVESGMHLGLGTGSTVAHFLELLGDRVRAGDLVDVTGVATSVETADRAHALGIPVGSLPEVAPLDLAVDGADEIDPALDLVKGLGGALLREKMVAVQARRFVIIADAGKRVTRLGTRSPLPVEVTPFAWEVHLPFVQSLGGRAELRTDGEGTPVSTDNGNYVLDCRFEGGVDEPRRLEERLKRRPGVVETGLFLGMAGTAFVAGEDGVHTLRRDEDR